MAAEAFVTMDSRRKMRRLRFAGPWLAGIVIGAVAAILLLQLVRSRTRELTVASLASMASYDARPVEARLSGGFPWAPFRGGTRGQRDADQRRALASAQVLPPSATMTRHAAGIAQLLAERDRDALKILTEVAESSNDPQAWSDLGAATLAASVRFDAPDLLADALAATDQALSRTPKAAEALFNRALILERLGLRDDAREAWEEHLRHEADARWGAEAREHLRGLAPTTPFPQFLDRDLARFAGEPALAARALIERNREEARTEGAIEILGRWAAAESRGDRTDADRWLRLARETGVALSRLHGDRMLERSVAAIDAADAGTRAALVAAHGDYTTGIRTYRDNRPTEAEPILNRAAAALDRTGSPLTLMARFYAANTVFDQEGRREEAREMLGKTLAATPADYPACRAHVLSQIGACHFARTSWGDAMRVFEESAAIFERLGEASNAGALHRVVSIIYDQNDDRERAWTHRMLALRNIGRESNLRLAKVVSAIAQDAMLRHKWRVALSFLNVEAAIARRTGDAMNLSETLLFRAAVRERMNDAAGARADVTESGEAAAAVKDESYRAHVNALALMVRAMLTESPAEADALLTQAIAFESTRGDRKDVPRLLLQRARARRAGGNVDGAAADLDQGIAALERERASLPGGVARWGAFHSAAELFDDAVDLALDTGDVGKAFAVAEKGRARSLIEGYGNQTAFDPRLLPSGTVIVEYAATASRLVIFTVDAAGVRATAVPYDHERLAQSIQDFVAALQSDDGGSHQAGAALWRQLVGPVATRIAGAATVAFVPDALTAAVPFGALVDAEGKYLLQSHEVLLDPSAAVFAAASARRAQLPRPRSVLIVANAKGGEETSSLAFVRAEAERVAQEYAIPIRIRDDGAQYDELVKKAAEADVIHFAGHAVGDDSGLEPASILLQQDGEEHRIGAAAIASLPLKKTSVVVLAGCSTARGEQRGREGVISVAHGFLSAGAPAVIATLWPIDDESAARVFPRVHELLARGVPPAEALRRVQLEAIGRGDVPASFWAALQVIGR